MTFYNFINSLPCKFTKRLYSTQSTQIVWKEHKLHLTTLCPICIQVSIGQQGNIQVKQTLSKVKLSRSLCFLMIIGVYQDSFSNYSIFHAIDDIYIDTCLICNRNKIDSLFMLCWLRFQEEIVYLLIHQSISFISFSFTERWNLQRTKFLYIY